MQNKNGLLIKMLIIVLNVIKNFIHYIDVNIIVDIVDKYFVVGKFIYLYFLRYSILIIIIYIVVHNSFFKEKI